MQFDPDEYRADISHFELTKQQEDELLLSLFHIMKTFVELGWGVENTQLALKDMFRDSDKSANVNL